MSRHPAVKDIIADIINFFFPRYCSVCGKRLLKSEKSVCIDCLLELSTAEYADGHQGNTLERLFWLKMPIRRAAAFLVYDHETSQRNLILHLKYHNRPKIGLHIAPIMVDRLNQTHFFDSIDVIVPIPISRKRRIHRGYNQSEQIAKGISLHTGIPLDTHSVRRRHYRKSQTKLSLLQRQKNVEDTFVLSKNHTLRNKHILIIDDVITTTATIRSCAAVLADIEGLSISVLSLAVSKNLLRNVKSTNPHCNPDEDV